MLLLKTIWVKRVNVIFKPLLTLNKKHAGVGTLLEEVSRDFIRRGYIQHYQMTTPNVP